MTCHTNGCVKWSLSVVLYWFISKTNMYLFEDCEYSKHQFDNKTKYFHESFNTLEVKKITDCPCFKDINIGYKNFIHQSTNTTGLASAIRELRIES